MVSLLNTEMTQVFEILHPVSPWPHVVVSAECIWCSGKCVGAFELRCVRVHAISTSQISWHHSVCVCVCVYVCVRMRMRMRMSHGFRSINIITYIVKAFEIVKRIYRCNVHRHVFGMCWTHWPLFWCWMYFDSNFTEICSQASNRQ